jgi:acetyltransferase-like isoleucine patch superfamily enzyme
MKILLIIIVAVLIMYVADLMVCLGYCVLKKRKDKEEWLNRERKETDSYMLLPMSGKKRILLKVKRLLNGWMIYRVKRLGKIPSQKYRIFILKHIFRMDISAKVVIYSWDTIRAPWNISVGEGTIIGNDAYLDGRNYLKIGRNVNISGRATIHTEQHDINDSYFRSLQSGGMVTIEDRAWVSSNTIILPGVKVGEGAVLAAGAVMTKDAEPFSIYVGIPAKKIKARNNELKYEFDGTYLPFI